MLLFYQEVKYVFPFLSEIRIVSGMISFICNKIMTYLIHCLRLLNPLYAPSVSPRDILFYASLDLHVLLCFHLLSFSQRCKETQ